MQTSNRLTLLRRLVVSLFLLAGIPVLVFLGISLVPLTPTVPSLQPRASTQYWVLQDDHRIAYTHLDGDRTNQNPPVLFLHGGPGGYIHSSIIRQMEIVSQLGYDVYLYDQMGSGLSDRLEKPKAYRFTRHVADLKEIVTSELGVPQVILIGQSFGSILAAHFLADQPTLVAKVVFASPGPLMPDELNPDGSLVDVEARYPTPVHLDFKAPMAVWEETERMTFNPRVMLSSVCALLFNCKWASDPEMDGLVNTQAAYFTQGLVCDPQKVLAEEGGGGGYSHLMSNWYVDVVDPRPKLADIDVPTLVLQGQCDQTPYAYAYEYVALTGGEYIFMEGAGHEIWWEQPKAFTTAITTFLASEP